MEYRRIDGKLIKKTAEEWAIYDYEQLDLAGKRDYACNLVNANYSTYCEQGLSYTDGTEYTIDNNSKTRDESAKKLLDLNGNIQSSFDWTMDSPRTKITFANEQSTITFVDALKTVIANNEIKLRDKKTEIYNMTLVQVEAWVADPDCPTYERVIV